MCSGSSLAAFTDSGGNLASTEAVPISIYHNLVFITAIVGSVPGTFILDTGASSDILNRSFALRLSSQEHSSNARISGVVGTSNRELPTLKDVSIALRNVKWISHSVPIVDLSSVENAIHHPVDGLLNPAHIPSAAIAFDYPGQRILLESSGLALLPKNCVLAFAKKSPPVVQAFITPEELKINIHGKVKEIPVKLLVDTGADHTLLLNSFFSAKHPELFSSTGEDRGTTIGMTGSMPVSIGAVRSLRLALLYTDRLPAESSSAHDGVSARASFDGSVGGALMATMRVTIDYRNGLIEFEPSGAVEKTPQLSEPCSN